MSGWMRSPKPPGAITAANCVCCATARAAATASRCPRSGPPGMWRSGRRTSSPCPWSSRTLIPTPPPGRNGPPAAGTSAAAGAAEASPSRRRRRSRRSGRSPVRRKRSVPMGPGPTTSPAVPAASLGTSPRRTVPSRRRAAPPSRLSSPRRMRRPRRAPSPAAVPPPGAAAPPPGGRPPQRGRWRHACGRGISHGKV